MATWRIPGRGGAWWEVIYVVAQSRTRLKRLSSSKTYLVFKRIYIHFREGFPGGSDGKESAYSVGDLGSIPGSGRSSGEGNGNPLQYSCLENPIDKGAW